VIYLLNIQFSAYNQQPTTNNRKTYLHEVVIMLVGTNYLKKNSKFYE